MFSDYLKRFNNWAFKNPSISTSTSQAPANLPGTGALIDTRTEAEKEGDIHFGELVSKAAPVTWLFRAPSAWRKFSIFNQYGSSACVAFTMAKILGILRFLKDGVFVVFSMGDIYVRRANAPSGGMGSTDVFAIAGQGVTLDVLMPSQNLLESEINALKRTPVAGEVANLFRLGSANPIFAPIGDIDAIASIIQTTKKPVMVWYFFTAEEWSAQNGVSGDYNIPAVLAPGLGFADDAKGALRHSITAVDFALDAAGRKTLICEDSAWFGGYNRRVVTEEWHKTRNWFAGYPMNFANVRTAVVSTDLSGFAPFTQALNFIPWNTTTNAPANPTLHAAQQTDVTRLQKILQLLTDARGNTYFPLNVECTGYYGAATAAAVFRWQSDYQVAPQVTLDGLQGKFFGAASIVDMNKLIKGQ